MSNVNLRGCNVNDYVGLPLKHFIWQERAEE